MKSRLFLIKHCSMIYISVGIKKAAIKLRLFNLVARPGFEPRQTAPKTVVLPLYYQAIRSFISEWAAKIGRNLKFSK